MYIKRRTNKDKDSTVHTTEYRRKRNLIKLISICMHLKVPDICCLSAYFHLSHDSLVKAKYSSKWSNFLYLKVRKHLKKFRPHFLLAYLRFRWRRQGSGTLWKITSGYGFRRNSGTDPLEKQLDPWVQLLLEGGSYDPL